MTREAVEEEGACFEAGGPKQAPKRAGPPSDPPSLTAGLEPEPIVETIRLKVDGLIPKGAAGNAMVRAAHTVLDGGQWIDKAAMEQALGLLAEPPRPEPAPLTPRDRRGAPRRPGPPQQGNRPRPRHLRGHGE